MEQHYQKCYNGLDMQLAWEYKKYTYNFDEISDRLEEKGGGGLY
jgi:hypothetical protein